MSAPERLYGLAGAESMERDPEYVLDDVDPGGELVVEEWTVAPARRHLPTAERLLDWVIEWAGDAGEVDEHWTDRAADVALDSAVVARADELLDALAARIGYRMADRHVADLRYRWVPMATPPAGTGGELGSWDLVERIER